MKLNLNCPRLTVFRSNMHIETQIVDDKIGKTILSMSDREISHGSKTEKASLVGEKIAKLALEKKINKIVFDRRGYQYHGRVKALAEGARRGGLKF